jgi:AP-2 complex subunit sigma-1
LWKSSVRLITISFSNHLLILEIDNFFDNVCELDLVFNFYKVYAILDEIFLAGEIEETSKDVVLERLAELEKLE